VVGSTTAAVYNKQIIPAWWCER